MRWELQQHSNVKYLAPLLELHLEVFFSSRCQEVAAIEPMIQELVKTTVITIQSCPIFIPFFFTICGMPPAHDPPARWVKTL